MKRRRPASAVEQILALLRQHGYGDRAIREILSWYLPKNEAGGDGGEKG